jgi:hypothetical protein
MARAIIVNSGTLCSFAVALKPNCPEGLSKRRRQKISLSFVPLRLRGETFEEWTSVTLIGE